MKNDIARPDPIIPVTFNRKPKGSEEFLNQIVEALGTIIDRRPKGRLRKKVS